MSPKSPDTPAGNGPPGFRSPEKFITDSIEPDGGIDGFDVVTKRFVRIARLRAVMEKLAASSAVDWKALSGELRYADQAHLVAISAP